MECFKHLFGPQIPNLMRDNGIDWVIKKVEVTVNKVDLQCAVMSSFVDPSVDSTAFKE